MVLRLVELHEHRASLDVIKNILVMAAVELLYS